MKSITLWGILFLIVHAIKKDKKHEEYKASENFERYANDEWENYIPDCGESERPWSIELSSSKDHPVVQKLEAFSLS